MSFLAALSDFDLTSIGLLQRVLLVTDGTLTDILQVAFRESIGVRKLATEVGKPCVLDPLELKPDDVRMKRDILLYGQNTGNNYLYAESLLAIDRLPNGLRKELVESNKPIGRLWAEYRVETRKEILHISQCSPCELLPYFSSTSASGLLLRRSYRLLMGGRPVVIITEYFPRTYSPACIRGVLENLAQADAPCDASRYDSRSRSA
jgi:chorismate-pyruvate lyase